jgi:hypothetical protein
METITVTALPLCPGDEGDCIFWKGERRFRTDHATAKVILDAWAGDFSILNFTRSSELLSEGLQSGSVVEIAP